MTESASLVDGTGWTELHRAAGRGDVARLRDLLAAGDDPTERGSDGRTPYQVALAAGHRAAAALLRDEEDRRATDGAADRRWRPYCRGYRLADLRAFSGWAEPVGRDGEPLQDGGTIVYLHDDLRVTRSVHPEEDVLRDGRDPAWQRFCREALDFTVPDELDLLDAEREGCTPPPARPGLG
ncbi:ankyrin repeat domain-containing protein [Micromonospora okii]|uniref:ankyrin repeat domain-containing protein n=1 Tax=Micromonospora okii TaxID=1182970 RepID=UPI001E54BF09|nr:ankyrin repeat domain-containing protein [Micromonospora okii]